MEILPKQTQVFLSEHYQSKNTLNFKTKLATQYLSLGEERGDMSILQFFLEKMWGASK